MYYNHKKPCKLAFYKTMRIKAYTHLNAYMESLNVDSHLVDFCQA